MGPIRRHEQKPFTIGGAILKIVYHVLRCRVLYAELGENYFDERDRQAIKRRLVRRLETLGYQVELLASLKRPEEIFKVVVRLFSRGFELAAGDPKQALAVCSAKVRSQLEQSFTTTKLTSGLEAQ